MGFIPQDPAHFDPVMGNYTDLKPFRFWCQKVLPLVYDDSLSYYEVLCKVVDYLNKTMEDVGVLHDDVDALHTVYQQLQSYVNNYFSTLDVQEEINNKLDVMASDGTLDALLLPYFNAYKTEINGIVENQNTLINNQNTAINNQNTTISNQNATIDAQNEEIAVLKSRMDGFTNLPTGSTSGDAELIDIRTGADGITYSSAGVAVRSQFSDLTTIVRNNTDCEALVFTPNYIIPTATTPVDRTDKRATTGMKCCVAPCSVGDIFYLNGTGAETARMYCVIDSSGNHIIVSTENYTASMQRLIIPAGGSYLIINSYMIGDPQCYKHTPLTVKANKNILENSILLSSVGTEAGARVSMENPYISNTTENKHRTGDVDISVVNKHKHLYVDFDTKEKYNLLVNIVCRVSGGVGAYTTGWVNVSHGQDLYPLISQHLTNVTYISITYIFSTITNTAGVYTGINTLDNYVIFYGTPYKFEGSNNLNIISREALPTETLPKENYWYSYSDLTFYKGITYTVSTIGANTGKTIKFAIMNKQTSTITYIHSIVDNQLGVKYQYTFTPEEDSYLLFTNLRYASGSNFKTLKWIISSISVGDTIVFTGTANTLAFNIFVEAKVDSVDLYRCLDYTSNSGNKVVVVVDSNGNGDYRTISSAILNTNPYDTILIMSGTYNESIHMWRQPRNLIGVDRETCIIYSGSGLYEEPAIEMNIGSAKNLTFISGNDNDLSENSTIRKGYAAHIEAENTDEYSCVFDNCKFISYLNAGVGIGCRYNQKIIFTNCYFETKAHTTYSAYTNSFINSGALLFHNDGTPNKFGNGLLQLNDCELKGVNKTVMCESLENHSYMTVRFNKCIAYKDNESTNDIVGYWGIAGKGQSPNFCGTCIKLDKFSCGNLSDELNYTDYWNN